MTAKHLATSVNSTIVPVVLFGVDEHGKPKAATFADKYAGLAAKAAQQLQLQVLRISKPDVAELAASLPVGRIHANGKGFVPYIKRELYAKLLAAANTAAAADHGSAGETSSVKSDGNPSRPRNWDEIAPGHVVVALQSPEDGWYEAIVVQRVNDMLTMRWRDYPRERRITQHRLSVALLYPDAQAKPAATESTAAASASRKSAKASSAKSTTRDASNPEPSFPQNWDDIDLNHLVLAKEDGPLRSWWEAIPTNKTCDKFTLRWRDFPQIPQVVRPRLSLALMHPKP